MAPITAKTKAKAAQMSPRKRKITKKPPPTAQKPIWGKPLREEKGLAKARFPPLGGRLYYYDFSPFLTCPAVVSHARSHHAGGRIVPVPIPETSIPSPLANNLAPQTLFDLKRFLVGMFDRFGRNGLEGQGGNGKEIWETWLRAWCLWNNYYIQGRINHDWIKRCSMLKGDKIRAGSTTSGHIDEKLRRFLSSGGFCAMKHMDLYQETSTETQYVKEDWHDAVENSIWRPRRLGEEDGDPIIDLDEDLDAFHAESGLNVDGGVDCGRSPYPVLRPIIRYVKTGIFKKQKAWDEVASTIFNMPTQASPDVDGDEDVFPLDVRRVRKVSVLSKDDDAASAASALETVHTLPSMPAHQYRVMEADDPYWVTEAQRVARDIPPRRQPPPEDIEYTNLPFDGSLWKKEVQHDQRKEALYFVTNLDGRTIVINGMEIHKGEVAGPLPAFAVIETSGGQVSFWWGVGGRNWRAGSEDQDAEQQWNLLRSLKGWGDVGVETGNVLKRKMIERVEGGLHIDQRTEGGLGDGKRKKRKVRGAEESGVRGYSKPHGRRRSLHVSAKESYLPVFDSMEEELLWVSKTYEKYRGVDIQVAAQAQEPPSPISWARSESREEYSDDDEHERETLLESQRLALGAEQKETERMGADKKRKADDAATIEGVRPGKKAKTVISEINIGHQLEHPSSKSPARDALAPLSPIKASRELPENERRQGGLLPAQGIQKARDVKPELLPATHLPPSEPAFTSTPARPLAGLKTFEAIAEDAVATSTSLASAAQDPAEDEIEARLQHQAASRLKWPTRAVKRREKLINAPLMDFDEEETARAMAESLKTATAREGQDAFRHKLDEESRRDSVHHAAKRAGISVEQFIGRNGGFKTLDDFISGQNKAIKKSAALTRRGDLDLTDEATNKSLEVMVDLGDCGGDWETKASRLPRPGEAERKLDEEDRYYADI